MVTSGTNLTSGRLLPTCSFSPNLGLKVKAESNKMSVFTRKKTLKKEDKEAIGNALIPYHTVLWHIYE